MFDLNERRLSLWNALHYQTGQKDYEAAEALLQDLYALERYWAFPGLAVLGRLQHYFSRQQKQLALTLIANVLQELVQPRIKKFSPYSSYLEQLEKPRLAQAQQPHQQSEYKPCFEVLIMHPEPAHYYYLYNNALLGLQSDRDEFFYDLVFVSNQADALAALYNNPNIQACVSLSGCQQQSEIELANHYWQSSQVFQQSATDTSEAEQDDLPGFVRLAKNIRPDVDHYYISTLPFAELEAVFFQLFQRVFYYEYPFKDLHYYLMGGVRERYNTPFHHALLSYSKKPKSVFHALPISRASSIKGSIWVRDFYQFYGKNIFDAETSSTQGGLDSLLNPKGAIKNAQDKAQHSFGSQKSFFVTNGTSTSNKIVMQANLRPGDIVFVSSDCHKSVPYGVVLSGADVFFMQTNAVNQYDLYGAIPLQQIKQQMQLLQKKGLLHKLKQIVLTNSTFDGLIYDVESYMMEILAIKPDVIFHWDEAWYAHAHFNPLYQRRHAMTVAKMLRRRFDSEAYRQLWQQSTDKSSLPDPDKVKLRVYATQSTHKTLSSFRQGSMIHIYDECFNQDAFLDAYYTHTSTSPNYQVLASLDIARRQMALEGYALTQNAIRLAVWLKQQIAADETVSQVFRVLDEQDIFPEQQKTPMDTSAADDYLNLLNHYQQQGMMVDPTRITLDIRQTGLSGGHFRKLLIDKYDIQVNKTSRHTVLFIVNIGATWQSVQYLFQVLCEIAEKLLARSPQQQTSNQEASSMPQQRCYHRRYLPYEQHSELATIANIRRAFYDAYDEQNIDYISISTELMARAQAGETWVSAVFVTPYPPGFPLLVPGQIIDHDTLLYLSGIINDEIHGFHREKGLKVFSKKLLEENTP